MASEDHIKDRLHLLVDSCVNQEVSESQFTILAELWADVDDDVLTAACKQHIVRSKYFPKPAEIMSLIQDETYRRTYMANATTHVPEIEAELELAAAHEDYERIQREIEEQSHWPTCEPCAGAGFVFRLQSGELVTVVQWRAMNPHTSITCGTPTADSPWETCGRCHGSGKQRPRVSGFPAPVVVEDGPGEAGFEEATELPEARCM